MYVLYNKTKRVRGPEWNRYQDFQYTDTDGSRVVRNLMENDWKGGQLAIIGRCITSDDYESIGIDENPFLAKSYPITQEYYTKKPECIYAVCDNEYVEKEQGFIERVKDTKDGIVILREDDLMHLLVIGNRDYAPGDESMLKVGDWGFRDITLTNDKPEAEDISRTFCTSGFPAFFTDKEIYGYIAQIRESFPEEGYDGADLTDLFYCNGLIDIFADVPDSIVENV